MAILVEFAVPADEFPLGSLFSAVPEATVELERIVPTNGAVFPYLWISGADRHDVTAALEASPPAETFTLVDELDDGNVLFRAEWDPTANGIVSAIVDSNVTLLSAVGKRNQWRFRLRADDHDAIKRFQSRCRTNDVRLSVRRLQPLESRETNTELTLAQLEALELAFERGYFDDPRRATLDDLATELGITRQSLAGRLRRGHRNLLARLFGIDEQVARRPTSFSAE
ncbi:helix-turn-helix domain-containing protein [Natronorubrum texcoconense]|uniref:Predicted DNA binding protein, contains HTH domain n=1 Tax=Natronorubrum texcoconense TaxID=1095776 RepID=A0A1G9B902_9EURY|nr:helix-turn-helix domain-containing protein [Natronorubrum texcoconense]SDK35500.1 Predicted DNA binding protein, contains HTH domain [Natronorubrum texcoconense]